MLKIKNICEYLWYSIFTHLLIIITVLLIGNSFTFHWGLLISIPLMALGYYQGHWYLRKGVREMKEAIEDFKKTRKP